VKFAWIAAEKAGFRVSDVCRALGVTRSGFYAWARRPESAHARRDRQLTVLVRTSFEGSKGRYGSPRIHRDLEEQGQRVSRKRVVRLMQHDQLQARQRKRFKCTTMSDHDQPIAANLLDRQFTAAAPNQRWVGDTTEFVIGESGKLYLAAILDLFSRLIVGWAVSAVNDRHLTLKALGDGAEAPVSGCWAAAPLRPGLHVRERGLSTDARCAWPHLFDEPARRLLRQRRDGSLLFVAQERGR
jgi:putative transposase